MAEHNILENFNIGVLDNLCYLHIAKDSHVKINFADLPKLSDDSRVCVSACRALHSIYRHYKEDFLTDGSNVLFFCLIKLPDNFFVARKFTTHSRSFDHLALQVVTYIHSLPPHLRPDSKEQWMDKLNYPFNNWVYIRFLFILPFVHSESLEHSAVAKALCTELRVAIENHTGLEDSYLARGIAEIDGAAFSHLSLEGPAKNFNGNVNMPSYAFWFLAVLDAHTPVLRRFNRFPGEIEHSGGETQKTKSFFYNRQIGLGVYRQAMQQELKRALKMIWMCLCWMDTVTARCERTLEPKSRRRKD
ncbi:hypothetical protein H4I96_07306 [Botrytis cinerea]